MRRQERFRGLIPGLLLLIVCSCNKPVEPIGRVVATLGGKTISVNDLKETAQFVGLNDLALRPLDKWPQALKKTIFQETVYDRLLLDNARHEGVSITDEEIASERERLVKAASPSGQSDHFSPSEALLRRKLLLEKSAATIAPPPRIGTKVLKAYYLEHKDRFSVQEKVIVRDIVVRSENEGNSILAALNGGNSFSALAKAKSLSPEAQNGGLLPPYAMGEMPSPFYRAFSMKPGEVSPLIPSPYGYHILKLLKIIPPSVRPFSDVKDLIRSEIDLEAENRALKNWFSEQLAKTPLVIRPHYKQDLSFPTSPA
jgi:peptidyl-prolyl cis-trans isomerase C